MKPVYCRIEVKIENGVPFYYLMKGKILCYKYDNEKEAERMKNGLNRM